jgi:hypothetical protein
MKAFISTFLLIVVVIIFFAGLTGFVPYLSSFLGTDKPRDLGVSTTKEDLAKAQEKSGVIVVDLPKDTPIEESYRLSGQVNKSFSLTSAEATAIINDRPTKYSAFSNVQLKLNPDGTMEASGMVDMSRVLDFAKSLGYATDDINKALSEYNLPRISMPFYIKGTGSILDNKVTVSIQSFQAGRIPLPSKILNANMGRINSFAQDVIGRQTGFSAKKWAVENEKIVFDGTLPEKESVVPK